MKETTATTATTATTTAPETGETGKDFPRLPFETQVTIISACLTNSAKRIEEKTGLEVMPIRFSEDEELTQESFLLCLERAGNDKYNHDPLPLFVSRCTSSALNKILYHGGKVQITEREIEKYFTLEACERGKRGTDSPVDSVIAMKEQKTFPAPESGIMREDFRSRILDGIRPAVRETAEKLLTGIESGYSINESAKLAGISAKRAMEVYQMLLNSTAVVLAEDGEENRLLKAIESDTRTMGNLSRRLESAYAYAIASPIYKREREKREVVEQYKTLSYIDRIVWAGKNQSELKKLFRK